MKINLSYPATGCQKLIDIADELKVNTRYIVSVCEYTFSVCHVSAPRSMLTQSNF